LRERSIRWEHYRYDNRLLITRERDTMKYQHLFCFILILVIPACTAVADFESTTPTQPASSPTIDVGFTVPVLPTQEPQKDSTQMTQPTPPPYSSGLEGLIEKAKEDLAQRLSISISQIDLVEAKEVVWPDASIGCPQPGMMYAQVQTMGFLVQLEAAEQVYSYHTDMDNTIILCESNPKEKRVNKDTDKNVEDGWPNQTKDKDVIIVTPTRP
jgi:hypothetical protein